LCASSAAAPVAPPASAVASDGPRAELLALATVAAGATVAAARELLPRLAGVTLAEDRN
jgi:hypothetical protein